MKLENANRKAMSKILDKLKKNETNIGFLVKDIGQHLKDCGEQNTVADALRWAENMLGKSPKIQAIPFDNDEISTSLSIKSIQPINNGGLKHYLKRSKFAFSTVDKYTNQAWVFDHKSQKSFIALTYKNESGGDEITNHYMSSTKSKNDITFIRGNVYKPKGVHIFKNLFDFLALLSHRKVSNLDEDSIILNSWANLPKVTPYIKSYGYKFVCCWLATTKEGIAATRSIHNFIKTEIGTRFINMVNVYKEHVCLFNWHLNCSDNPSS